MTATIIVLLFTATTHAANKASGHIADRMTVHQLKKAAKTAVRKGHIHSTRWGDATPWLRRLSTELVERAFRPYGTQQWALYIVHRESGGNPGAVNRYSGCAGLMQVLPSAHPWVNIKRLKADPGYAAAVFVRMSHGGSYRSPWYL